MKKTVRNLVLGSAFLGLGAYLFTIIRDNRKPEEKHIYYYNNPRNYINLTEIHHKKLELKKELNEVDKDVEKHNLAV